MLKKLADKITLAAASAKDGFTCPDCGLETAAEPRSLSEIITCTSCGTKASAEEWASASEIPKAHADSPPPSTAIRKHGDGLGGTVWDIPASGKFGFFIFFAAFWLTITVLVSGGFLLAILGGGEIEGDMPGWAIFPFFSIFYLVGFGLLYAGIRQKYLKQRLSINRGEVTLQKMLLGNSREKKLASGTVKSVTQEVFYSQNYTPVYGIQIRGKGGKIRFGSALTDEEKAWLVADINESIFGPEEVAAPAFHEGGSRGEGKTVFSIPIPGAGKGSWLAAASLALMGIGFLIIGFVFIADDPSSGPASGGSFISGMSRLFDILDSVFLVVWSVISASAAIAGLVWLIHLFRSRNVERRIEGSAAQVSIRSYRHGLVVKDDSYPRDSISAVRSSVSGSSNEQSLKRVELIAGEKAVRLVSWHDGDRADDLVAELRSSLGL